MSKQNAPSNNSYYKQWGGVHNFMHSHGIKPDSDGYVEARKLVESYKNADGYGSESEESEHSDNYDDESFEQEEQEENTPSFVETENYSEEYNDPQEQETNYSNEDSYEDQDDFENEDYYSD
jgi:hypothetical protein